LEIEIPESLQRPHYAKNESGEWMAYVRVADQNFQANRILINFWKNEHKRRGAWLRYGPEEKILMDYLAVNGKITLSGFGKIARTSRLRAERVLTSLMLMHIIDIEQTEETAYFHLKTTALNSGSL
jgi:hypothetical protein